MTVEQLNIISRLAVLVAAANKKINSIKTLDFSESYFFININYIFIYNL